MSILTPGQDLRYQAQRRAYALGGPVQVRDWELPAGDGAWTLLARCGQQQPGAPDPDMFFPLKSDSAETYQAQAYCAQCPVRDLCDQAATKNRWVGVWGGILRDDRGNPVPLCKEPGCLRYRAVGAARCGPCGTRFGRPRASRAASQTPATELVAETTEREVVMVA
jgi:hypothetical protein